MNALFFSCRGEQGIEYFLAAASLDEILSVTEDGRNPSAISIKSAKVLNDFQKISFEKISKEIMPRHRCFLEQAIELVEAGRPVVWIGLSRNFKRPVRSK